MNLFLGSTVARVLATLPVGVLLASAQPGLPTLASAGPAARFRAVPAPSPNLPRDPGVSINDMSCATPNFCVAVGSVVSSVNGLQEASIYTLAGSTWRADFAPLPANASPSSEESLEAIHCFSPGSCEAVGLIHNQRSIAKVVVLRDSNNSWRASDHFSNGPAVQASWGMSLACVSKTSCVIAGAYLGGKSGNIPLLGDGSGLSWSFSAVPTITDSRRRIHHTSGGRSAGTCTTNPCGSCDSETTSVVHRADSDSGLQARMH